MTITLAIDRDPVPVDLSGPLTGVSVMLRPLNPWALSDAVKAVHAVVSDKEKLLAILTRNDLLPPGGETAWNGLPTTDLESYVTMMAGLGEWLSGVELAGRAIVEWRGFAGLNGEALPLSREALEAAMLVPAFQEQVLARIGERLILRSEGATH